MVIVQLIGGLGNQLFQYAAGRAIAQHCGTTLKIDVSAFEYYPLRAYRLAYFNIIEEFATLQEVQRLKPRRRQMLVWLYRWIEHFLLPSHRQPVFHEQSQAVIEPDVFKINQDVYLIGYWQSEYYFSDIADLIRREFTWKHAPDALNESMLATIEQTNSVSIHIRRGDYVTNAETNRFHGSLGIDYYENAIAFVASRVSNPHFFVFSDDMPWVKENLRLAFPATYVEHNGAAKDYEDLRLMSHCKHHIIANSSFSWWGAWLASFPEKIVVAPRKWFAQTDVDVSSRYPVGWNLL